MWQQPDLKISPGLRREKVVFGAVIAEGGDLCLSGSSSTYKIGWKIDYFMEDFPLFIQIFYSPNVSLHLPCTVLFKSLSQRCFVEIQGFLASAMDAIMQTNVSSERRDSYILYLITLTGAG